MWPDHIGQKKRDQLSVLGHLLMTEKKYHCSLLGLEPPQHQAYALNEEEIDLVIPWKEIENGEVMLQERKERSGVTLQVKRERG